MRPFVTHRSHAGVVSLTIIITVVLEKTRPSPGQMVRCAWVGRIGVSGAWGPLLFEFASLHSYAGPLDQPQNRKGSLGNAF